MFSQLLEEVGVRGCHPDGSGDLANAPLQVEDLTGFRFAEFTCPASKLDEASECLCGCNGKG